MGYMRISWQRGSLAAATLCFVGCAVGPNYHKPRCKFPRASRKASTGSGRRLTRRARCRAPVARLSRRSALEAHRSSLARESDHHRGGCRLPIGTSDRLGKHGSSVPTVSASTSATRAQYGSIAAKSVAAPAGTYHYVTAGVSASWELDLWGKTRRQIESSKALAQASDAQRAGQRLSIAASVASDYFALRQADIDIDFCARSRKYTVIYPG